MKRMFVLLVVGMLASSTATVHAASGCCAIKTKPETTKADCMQSFAGLQLTDEQKAKLQALSAECAAKGCSREAHSKFTAKVKDVLTPEQFRQWQQQCQKMRKSGCCVAATQKPGCKG